MEWWRSFKDKQKSFDEKVSHLKRNSTFVDNHITELQVGAVNMKDEITDCRKQILYVAAYSRRENLKFERIPLVSESLEQQNATPKENTKEVLFNFMENILTIKNAKNIEFQRVHRMGKPKNDSGNGSRKIVARFVRFSRFKMWPKT